MDTSVLDILRDAVPGASLERAPPTDMPTLVADREHLVEVCRTLRDHASLQFALLADLTAVDCRPADPRFEVVYHLACLGAAFVSGPSAAPARRLRLKVRLSDKDARVPSIVSVYPGANWLEREVFDLFGIAFSDHPDLRRILMPEDWQGYPLRKDYPVQIHKDTVAWEPVQLSAAEFAENIRMARQEASRIAEGGAPPEPPRRSGRGE